MYEEPKYIIGLDGKHSGINCTVNGVVWFVPLDENNTDYANIMQLVTEGKLTIAPAEGASN